MSWRCRKLPYGRNSVHPNKKNLIGMTFGQLRVIAEYENYVSPKNGRERTQWLCKCRCGRVKPVLTESLRSGAQVRCGECFSIIPENGCMKYICPDGDFFLFDKEDEPLARSRLWAIRRGYARACVEGVSVSFHRLIMNAGENEIIDHIDGNPRNNCKSNLRLSTQQQNMRNTHIRCDNTTGYKGVSFVKRIGRYEAYINNDGRKIPLGLYDTAQEAALAYNRAASSLFGEYARINVIGAPWETRCVTAPLEQTA